LNSTDPKQNPTSEKVMPVDWNAHCRNKKAETAAPDPWLVKILPLLPVGARKDLQRSDFLRQRLPTALASPARKIKSPRRLSARAIYLLQ
jgi:hypothetical protein